jgi:hypothetical protein
MLDNDALLELVHDNSNPCGDIEFIKQHIDSPPFGHCFEWTNFMPRALWEIWDQLSLEAKTVAFWVANCQRTD